MTEETAFRTEHKKVVEAVLSSTAPVHLEHGRKETSSIPGESSPHFAALDGMRGIAALVVLAFHCLMAVNLPYPAHGLLAVDFFFCLSGFVVAYAYEDRLLTGMSFAAFARTRLIRLYPLILLGLLLGASLFAVRCLSLRESILSVNAMASFVLEAFMVPVPRFLYPEVGGTVWHGIAPYDVPAWSLFFELVANFIYALFIRRLDTRRLFIISVIAALALAVESFGLNNVSGGDESDTLLMGFTRIAFSFTAGLLVFRKWTQKFDRPSSATTFPLLAFLLIVFFVPVPLSLNGLYECAIVVFAFPALIWQGTKLVPARMTQATFLFLGRLSFPIYILHGTLGRVSSNFIRQHQFEGPKLWLACSVEATGLVIFAWIAMKVLDEPARRWLSKKGKKL